MCFKCVAEKMDEAELLRTFEFAQDTIGLARLIGNDEGVKQLTLEMIVTKSIWQKRENEMIAQINAGQSILMDYLKQKRKKQK